MKFLFLILTLFILSGWVSHATSVSNTNTQPTPTIENANFNANNQYSYTDYKYDSALMDKLNSENEKFRVVPDEFKSVDFKNFKYDFGRMKNSEFEIREPDNPLAGSQSYTFNNAFYVDLVGDSKKEAVVFLYEVGCGVSCDGGRDLVYFFDSNNGKIKRFAIFETGSNAGGCSLKSFTIKAKKIYVEQFGRCKKNPVFDEEKDFVCKFCSKDETHSIYAFSKNELIRDSVEIIETNTVNVMNSPAYISINE